MQTLYNANMNNNLYIANRLFAGHSFMEGMGRLLDLDSTMQKYNTSKNDSEADMKALRNDWRAVGDDLRFSIRQYGKKFAR